MRTIYYEIIPGDQHVTVIPPMPINQVPATAMVFVEQHKNRDTVKRYSFPADPSFLTRRYMYPQSTHTQTLDLPPLNQRVEEIIERKTPSPPLEVRDTKQKASTAQAPSVVTVEEYRPTRERKPSPHPNVRNKVTFVERASSVNGRRDNSAGPRKQDARTSLASVAGSVTGSTTASTRSIARRPAVSSAVTLYDPKPDMDFASADRTAARNGTFYFAYGLNLSPSRLRAKLSDSSPSSSSKPIAIAKLENHTWYVSSRGVANLGTLSSTSRSHAQDANHEHGHQSDADVVWGLLYHLRPEDEKFLDIHENWMPLDDGAIADPDAASNIKVRQSHPWIQGKKAPTNKVYLTVEIEDWFVNPRSRFGLTDNCRPGDSVRVMTYVDENNTRPGRISRSYAKRMSEAASAGVEYGIPANWVTNVMGMYGIQARDQMPYRSASRRSSARHSSSAAVTPASVPSSRPPSPPTISRLFSPSSRRRSKSPYISHGREKDLDVDHIFSHKHGDRISDFVGDNGSSRRSRRRQRD